MITLNIGKETEAALEDDPQLLREPYRIYLDHAIRLWAAEEENSRRIAGRAGLMITASFGFVGVVLLRFGLASVTIPAGAPRGFLCATLVLLALGLLCLAVSSALLFGLTKVKWWVAARSKGSVLANRLRRNTSAEKTDVEKSDEEIGDGEANDEDNEGEQPASKRLSLPSLRQKTFRKDLDFVMEENEFPPLVKLAVQQMSHQADRYYEAISELRRRNAREKYRMDRAQLWLFPGVLFIALALACWMYTGIEAEEARGNSASGTVVGQGEEPNDDQATGDTAQPRGERDVDLFGEDDPARVGLSGGSGVGESGQGRESGTDSRNAASNEPRDEGEREGELRPNSAQ